jgi:lipopolysaccharide export system permease protein
MPKLEKYLLNNISAIFFNIFFTIFFIVSIIFLVKISAKSAVLNIDFIELLTIYSYFLPTILYFTIPIVFFVSITVVLSRLSLESELISVLAVGISPKNIGNVIFKISILVTLLLFILSIVLRPLANQSMDIFIEQKKADVSINTNSNDFGQKFGDWSVIIEQKDNNKVNNIILYNRATNQLIDTQKAYTQKDDFSLNLILENGRMFSLQNDIYKEVLFKRLQLNDITQSSEKSYSSIVDYWSNIENKKVLKELVLSITISIIPTLFIPFILAIGILNPRNKNNHIWFFMISTIVGYLTIVFLLLKQAQIYTLVIAPIIFAIVGYYFYFIKIKKRF